MEMAPTNCSAMTELVAYDAVHRKPSHHKDQYVHINIGGMMYKTLNKTLKRFPSTLLGNKESRLKYYNPERNCYFFDRSRQCFDAILFYYQSNGLLLCPPDVSLDLFIEEVTFFELGEHEILRLRKEGLECIEDIKLPKRHWQCVIWKVFEYPETNFLSRFVAWWSVFVILLSICVICAESVPGLKDHQSGSVAHGHNWFLLEMGCIVWFTFEYITRMIVSPDKKEFFTSFLNTIDVLAILPYFVTTSVSMNHSVPFSVLRIVRLVRILRILKLTRHSLGLQILGQTLKASTKELFLLVCFIAICVTLFSSAMYFAESGKNAMFTSIPDAFWYSVVTMTTVGYGDKYPITFIGKLVGTLCAISGVLTIALPVPVIVSNFELFSKKARAMHTKAKERKKEEELKKKSCGKLA